MAEGSVGWRARLAYAWRLPWAEKLLLLQTLVALGVARAAVLRLDYARIERFMGSRLVERTEELDEQQRTQAARVARAIRRVSGHTPWNSNCFPQALAGAWLLRRRGIEPTIYLGARLDQVEARLLAHAWLRAGGHFIAGGGGARAHGTLISYARPAAGP